MRVLVPTIPLLQPDAPPPENCTQLVLCSRCGIYTEEGLDHDCVCPPPASSRASYTRYDFSNTGDSETAKLHPHPLNEKLYGRAEPDAALLESVRANGIFNPIIINRNMDILSGTRRWQAAKAAGFVKVPVLTLLHPDEDGLLSELFLIESNRQRIKTKGQIAREASELLRIEQALAAERQKTTRIKSGKPPARPSEGHTEGRATEVVAGKLGQSKNTVEKEVQIVRAAEAGDQKAKDALLKLDRNETSISSAYRAVQAPRKKQERHDQRESIAKQLQALFPDSTEVQPTKRWRFNLFFRGLPEEEIRRIAKLLAGQQRTELETADAPQESR